MTTNQPDVVPSRMSASKTNPCGHTNSTNKRVIDPIRAVMPTSARSSWPTYCSRVMSDVTTLTSHSLSMITKTSGSGQHRDWELQRISHEESPATSFPWRLKSVACNTSIGNQKRPETSLRHFYTTESQNIKEL